MKKLTGILIFAVMILLCTLSWKNILTMETDAEKEYASYISTAETYESKKIYVDAIEQYEKALKKRPENNDLRYKIADLYAKLGDQAGYMSTLAEAYRRNPTDLESCSVLIEHAMKNKRYQNAYGYVQKALQQETCVEDWLEEMQGYDLALRSIVRSRSYRRFDTVSAYAYPKEDAPSAVITIDGSYGVIDPSGSVLLEPIYEDAGFYGGGYFPVCENGEYSYVDAKAHRRRIPDFSTTWLGSFSEGYAPFQQGDKEADGSAAEAKGKYGYLDKNMKKYAVAFDWAGTFCNGYAPVQKDNQWMLLDRNFKKAFDRDFEEILVDENGYATKYGVFWAKEQGSYYLYDLTGKRCTEEGYEAVKPFASREACAVQTKNGFWGFLSIEGELVQDGIYADAQSYSCGYAPVVLQEEQDEENPWCLVDTDGTVILSQRYTEMTPLYPNGVFVARDTSDLKVAQYVRMYLYEQK